MAKVTKNFKFENPRQLEGIARAIGGVNCSLSAVMMPNHDDFIEASGSQRAFNASSDIPEIDVRLRGKQLNEDTLFALKMLPLCQKYGIMPFWCLVFDHSYSNNSNPQIEYAGPNIVGDIGDRFRLGTMHPVIFSQDSRWYAVSFKEFKGDREVKRVHQAIDGFSKKGYVLTEVYARLNPRDVRGDHCSYEEWDATLWANRDHCEARGVSEDFELPKDLPELPAPENALDNFVRGLLEKEQ